MVTESGNVAQSAITSTNNDSVGIKRSSDRRVSVQILFLLKFRVIHCNSL